ncbi:MAG: DUF542 domain-containing protein [Ginsengibacter sp.]
MPTSSKGITAGQLVTDIVLKDFRAAEVFRKYNIDFCCGGKMPLSMACELQGVNEDILMEELEHFAPVYESAKSWAVDFTIDYLINLHHTYFKNSLPVLLEYVDRFFKSHIKKFPESHELPGLVDELQTKLQKQLSYESDKLFPYIKRIHYAHSDNEVYGKLLMKTLQKVPVEDVQQHDAPLVELIFRIEELTNSFQPPSNACTTHKVMLQKLEEFTGYIRQHIFIERKILIPAAMQIERNLLEKLAETE